MFLMGKRLSGKYGLPVEPPQDRHRWLFSLKEARCFVQERALKLGFKLREEIIGYYNYRQLLPRAITVIGKVLCRAGIGVNLFAYYYCAVLERNDYPCRETFVLPIYSDSEK
jgi:hypothetical protein